MKDIMITIPKSIKFEDWLKECEYAQHKNQVLGYKVNTLPKQSGVGAKCYIVYDGRVRGYNEIIALEYRKAFTCQYTGIQYPDGNYIVRKPKFIPIDGWEQKEFQGFKYL